MAATWCVSSRCFAALCLLASATAKPTLYIIGDSTVRNQTAGQKGWGGPLVAHLRPGDFLLMQFGHNDGGELFNGDRPEPSPTKWSSDSWQRPSRVRERSRPPQDDLRIRALFD